MRLQDPDYTRVILVTLPETTPVSEAAALQDDLRRARIEPYAWVINRSLAATGVRDPVLHARLEREKVQVARVVGGHRAAGLRPALANRSPGGRGEDDRTLGGVNTRESLASGGETARSEHPLRPPWVNFVPLRLARGQERIGVAWADDQQIALFGKGCCVSPPAAKLTPWLQTWMSSKPEAHRWPRNFWAKPRLCGSLVCYSYCR